VGKLSQDLFPGGVDLSPANPFLYEKVVKLTQEKIQSGLKVFYEPSSTLISTTTASQITSGFLGSCILIYLLGFNQNYILIFFFFILKDQCN
jgi:hypothetical protein